MENPMLWVGYPRSYTPGRRRAPRLIVMHHTAGSEGPKSAEAGVAYDKTRLDGTSCHAFFDSEGPGLQEVPFGDRSHTAFFYGNEIGVHFELCGTLQTREQWLDPISLATLRTAAVACVYACETLGITPRKLSDAEVRRAWDVGDVSGICDHWAITRVFGLGNHTDLGPYFPWDVFMSLVNSSVAEETDMGIPYIQWGDQPNKPTTGYLIPGTMITGKPVIIPLTDTTKISNWRAGGMVEKWPPTGDVNPTGKFAPNAAYWHILPTNAAYDNPADCPPCNCDGGGAVEHVHAVAGVPAVPAGTTGPAVPTT